VLTATGAFAADAPTPKAQERPLNLAYMPVSLLTSMATLPADEQTKIQAVEDKLKSDTEAARGAGATEADRAKQRDLFEQANSDIRSILTPDQVTAIENYLPGVQLLARAIKGGPGGMQKITLTTDQLDKLKAINDDFLAKQKALEDGMKGQVNDVLTADQKAALDAKPERAAGGNKPK